MVQETLTDSENNIRFLMFASYGSTPMYSIASAPVDIPDDQILGINRLSFTREEIKAYVDNRFLARECLHGDTVSKFCSRLQLLTSNHVGLVVTAIDSLNEIYLSCTKSDTALPPAEDWIHLVEEGSVHQDRYNSGLFEALIATRALKVVRGLRPGDLVVLKRFLYEDVDPLDAVIQNLISVGVLVETVEGDLKFSSAAMWRYVVSKCTSPIQRGVVAPPTLQDLVVQAIRDINYDHVSKTLGRSLATGIPLERAWQMEFYLAAYRSTPSDTFVVSADVGAIFASPGFIDFTVHYEDDFWGIELLRERVKLHEHIARFSPNGDYSYLQLSDYCLIDFREYSRMDQTLLASDPRGCDKLFVVSYDANMRNVQLWNRNSTWNVR